MAAKGQSSAEKFSRWGITASNLREHLEEMPHVAADLAEMDRLIAEARALESQQEAIRGESVQRPPRLVGPQAAWRLDLQAMLACPAGNRRRP